MNTEVIDKISRYMEVDRETLLNKGLQAYLQDRKRQLILERERLLARYKVSSAAELEEQIRSGTQEEYPAWEDCITLENLDAAIQTLDGYLRDLQTAT